MSQKKIDVFKEYEDAELKHMQVVYLDKHGFSKEEISKYTGYAVSTIRSYIRKFSDLVEKSCKVFYHVTQKIKTTIQAGKQLVYLFKFYNNNELIYSKVGTTTRLPEQRLKEEIRYYKKHGIEVDNTEICSVIDCGDLPAEGAESYIRAFFIKKYPDSFQKNDRFCKVNLSTRLFNKKINEYLAETA